MPHFHCQIGMRVMERRGCCHFVDPVGHRIFFPSNAWCLLNVVRKENTMVLIWEGYKLEEGPETRQKIAEHVEVRAPSQANSLSISLIHTLCCLKLVRKHPQGGNILTSILEGQFPKQRVPNVFHVSPHNTTEAALILFMCLLNTQFVI